MSVTRSGGRGSRTSRTTPRRRSAGVPNPERLAAPEPQASTAQVSARAATAILERQPTEPVEGAPVARASEQPGGRRRRSARTEQRARTPRHRLLLACTGVLALGMLAVLLLNTIISQGAFRQHELEIDLILLAEKEEALARQVQLAETPIEVEKKARELGMVPAAAPVFLRLSDGKILGEPVPAEAATGPIDFTDAPGILPTPAPSASASGSAGPTAGGTAVDPALDPATGLDADATGAEAANPSSAPSPSVSANGAGTDGTTQAEASPSPAGQIAEGGNP